MFSFKEYFTSSGQIFLSEDAKPKLHLTHLEDLVIEEGIVGFNKFEEQIINLLNYLDGLQSEMAINLKIDGAPALFFGLDPREEFQGQFFIAMKAAFAKDPKIMHSIEEVESFYGGRGDLTEKLTNSFNELKKAYDASGETKVFQGDLIFASSQDKKLEVIDGVQYLTFKPNTIKYAVPVDEKSYNYNHVRNSLVGIFVHDSFNVKAIGNNIQTIPAGKDISKLVDAGAVQNVYIESSTYKTMDIEIPMRDKLLIGEWLKLSKSQIQNVSPEFDEFYTQSKLLDLVKMFLNDEVKKDPPNIYSTAITKSGVFKEEMFNHAFKSFLKSRLDKDIIKLKSDAGKERLKQQFSTYENIISQPEFQSLMIVTNYMIKIKGVLVDIFNKIEPKIGKSFLQNPDGSWRIDSGEGFVFFVGDNQVKLVDRLSFSRANLTQGKFQR